MAVPRSTPPIRFWIVAGLVTAWGLVGVMAFYIDATLTAASAKAQGYSDYDIALLVSRPPWFLWLYALATFSGLFGGIALLARSRHARALFVASLVGVVVQFGYIFAATDLLAVKGFTGSAPFPLFIVAVAAAQVWFAGLAARRGWIG